MATLQRDQELRFVRGVGERRAEAFASLGLHTVGDLLEYYPFRHEAELGDIEICELERGVFATVRGEVLLTRRNHPNFFALISDGTGECGLRWFNQQYGGRGLREGATVIATGRVQEYRDGLELVQPNIQVFETDADLNKPRAGLRLAGVYSGNARIKSVSIRRVVQNLLAFPELPIDEFLPRSLLRARQLPERATAIRQMHAPNDEQALEQARRRLAYEEFLLMETALALRRRRTRLGVAARKLHITSEIDARIRARFPFTLTASQNQAIGEIARDLESGAPMTRLLQGDVGSGKTVVALYACLAAIANGRQAAILAPTEILATQHFNNIEKYLAESRVRRVLLRGDMTRSRRDTALQAVSAGEMSLVVGTQALLEKDVAFRDLAMVVVDEQHKFGVMQRAGIRTKGPLPHYLVMTATPIPRTLAMTVFGDLDVTVLDASPPGRGKITTHVVYARQWRGAMERIRARLEAGEQAYVVCPLIGDEDPTSSAEVAPAAAHAASTSNLLSAHEAYRRLCAGPWKDLRIGLLHGGMKAADKAEVLASFSSGALHAIVATTVVEVGIDVANATIMVVEHAERFGLSQLHQLRGRVGRGAKDSLCVLIAYGGAARGARVSRKATERLAIMAETTNGFRIAEADLRLRGPGELLGTRQHGLPELRVGRLVEDFELLELARRDAFELVARDPKLIEPESAALVPRLKQVFGTALALIDAG